MRRRDWSKTARHGANNPSKNNPIIGVMILKTEGTSEEEELINYSIMSCLYVTIVLETGDLYEVVCLCVTS